MLNNFANNEYIGTFGLLSNFGQARFDVFGNFDFDFFHVHRLDSDSQSKGHSQDSLFVALANGKIVICFGNYPRRAGIVGLFLRNGKIRKSSGDSR
ncbi:MAG: hypothetical protein NT170_00680 [Candidatus Moranbacteria bacterium]|nr:hypothetical protein [Candidatus Moranbacteria bacterium]